MDSVTPSGTYDPQLPTGQQVTIAHGDQQLVSVAVAGGLRSYRVGGRELLDGFAADERPGGGRGQTLVPWPNRIAGARYSFDGADQQLPVTEPDTGNAIHGLGRWVAWQLLEQTESALSWGLLVPPQPGWPTSLRCSVRYALGPDGLSVTTTATNVGARPAPYGTGSHPYLRAATLVDAMTLQVPAGTWYETDDSGIPVATHPVEGDSDLRTAQQVRARVVDHCYGELERDADGRWRVVIQDDGHRVVVWADEAYGWVQLFSGDTLPEAARRRGLAVEPMTCPPDAFNSGAGVVRLEPGQTHSGTWGISVG